MCLTPYTMLNPKYCVSVACGDVDFVFVNGVEYYGPYFPKKFDFFKSGLHKNHDNLSDFFYTRRSTGKQQWPLVLGLPCRKCAECQSRKRSVLINRMLLEAKFHEEYSAPMHLTLTYDPKYVPEGFNVNLDDVSSFFHRLNVYMPRKGYDFKVRYLAFSEYGSEFDKDGKPKPIPFQPHYHVALFGVPFKYNNEFGWCFDKHEFWQFVNLIRQCWKKGFVELKGIPIKRLPYVAKYACKDDICPPPEGRKPNGYRMSVRGGGIGALESKFEYLDELFQLNNTVKIKLFGYTFNVSMPDSYKESFKPCVKSYFGNEFYRRFREFVDCGNTLLNIDYDAYFNLNCFKLVNRDELKTTYDAKYHIEEKLNTIYDIYSVVPGFHLAKFIKATYNTKFNDFRYYKGFDVSWLISWPKVVHRFNELYDYFYNYGFDIGDFEDFCAKNEQYLFLNKPFFKSMELKFMHRRNDPGEWDRYLNETFRKHAEEYKREHEYESHLSGNCCGDWSLPKEYLKDDLYEKVS